MKSAEDANQHWQRIHSHAASYRIEVETYASQVDVFFQRLLAEIGDPVDLEVLDLGCGNGELSVFLALKGARVTAVDFSEEATAFTNTMVEAHGVGDRVRTRAADAMQIDQLGQHFDLVVGKFILHHIELFDRFAKVLARVVKPGGRAIFVENNARNPVLAFARRFIAGHFGIPKYGNNEEYPFEIHELRELQEAMGEAKAVFPGFIFFRKSNTYIFRHRPIFKPLLMLNNALDYGVYHLFPGLRQFSYEQVVISTRL